MFPPRETGRWRFLAALLILAAAGLHIAYFSFHCPLDLTPDEAHYWDWSRHLDWSYYSKGPGTAYLIRAGCLLGGDTMPAVRLPAIICGSLLLVSLYILTVQVFGREKWAVGVIASALTLPVFVAGSSLMTIDAPFTCCWGWALVFGHRAIFGARSGERGTRTEEKARSARDGWFWPAAGLVVGLGILAKYTMVLWLPSVGLFLLTSREHRRLLGRPGFWIAAGIAAFCCVPILVWNAGHEWVTFRHVSGQAGLGNRPWSWSGPLVYLGSQAALLLGFWFAVWLTAMIAHRPGVESDASIRYLWWLSAPMFAVFLVFSVRNGGGQVNWPIAAYLSGLPLAVAWLGRRPHGSRGWSWSLAAAWTLGLGLSMAMRHAERLYPVLARLAGPPTRKQPLPLRRLDPTCRLRGWRTLAAEVDRLRAELAAEGNEPVLAGSAWTLPGELGFYCVGHPPVYSLGLALGDRRSQYDFWRPNPIGDPEAFRGRTFLIVGPPTPELGLAFEQVEPPLRVTHHAAGWPVSSWLVTICHGFRGFPPLGMLPGHSCY